MPGSVKGDSEGTRCAAVTHRTTSPACRISSFTYLQEKERSVSLFAARGALECVTPPPRSHVLSRVHKSRDRRASSLGKGGQLGYLQVRARESGASGSPTTRGTLRAVPALTARLHPPAA